MLKVRPRLCAWKDLLRNRHPRVRGARVVAKRNLVAGLLSQLWKCLASKRELGLRRLSHSSIRARGVKAGTGAEEEQESVLRMGRWAEGRDRWSLITGGLRGDLFKGWESALCPVEMNASEGGATSKNRHVGGQRLDGNWVRAVPKQLETKKHFYQE